MVAVTGLTIDDFERLPDALARNHELVDGELVEVSGNTASHNRLRDRLIVRLLDFVEREKLGLVIAEQEFQFQENAHGPDVSFLRSEKAMALQPRLRVQRFVPDLAIEIASRSDGFTALLEKAQLYLRCGVEEVWIFSIETRQALRITHHERDFLDDSQDFTPSTNQSGGGLRVLQHVRLRLGRRQRRSGCESFSEQGSRLCKDG